MNGCQQDFRSVAGFGFGGQESASKPPQSHMQTGVMMKTILRLSLIIILFANLNAQKQFAAEYAFGNEKTANKNSQLTIKIKNIEEIKGDIRIGVFNASKNFLKEGFTYKKYKIAVKNNAETIVIGDLPPGEYAFILYHDKNADGEMNRNFIGIPKEPFAFSNNVKPKFAKPTFEECKFSLEKNLALQVKLSYF